MKYYCNPININYRYQFNADQCSLLENGITEGEVKKLFKR